MTQRGQLLTTDADFSHAIIALGLGNTERVEQLDSSMLSALKVATVNAVGTDAGVGITVPGIQVGDTIVSAIRVRVEDDVSNYSMPVLEDVTSDVSVTDEEQVTFTEESFSETESLLLFYVDESAELS